MRPDGPVIPGGPRLPMEPGKPGGPGSYITLPNPGSPLRPVGIKQEKLPRISQNIYYW